jgi:hypothetical protein
MSFCVHVDHVTADKKGSKAKDAKRKTQDGDDEDEE